MFLDDMTDDTQHHDDAAAMPADDAAMPQHHDDAAAMPAEEGHGEEHHEEAQ